MMERYDAYKDSGIEWIGEIPDGWKIKKLKYDVSVNPSKDDIDKDSDELVVFLPMEKVSEDGKIDCSIKKPISELYSGFTFFKKHDVIVAKITPCFENGKGALLNELETNIGFGSTEFHVLRAKQDICKQFLYYITKSEVFMKVGEAFMSGAAGQKRVPTDFISDFPLASPGLDEQTAIANYLDRKTAEIDALIAQKQRLIALYEEEKTAIINQAVTQGTAPNVKLKDSGINWLGEIPKGWDVKKLKYFIEKLESGVSVNSTDFPASDNAFGVLKTSCVYNYSFNPNENKEIWQSEIERAKLNPRKGELIISRMNTPELVGASGYVEKTYENLFFPDRLWQTKFYEHVKIDTKWLSFVFKSLSFRKLLSIIATGTSPSMKNLAQDDFLSIEIPYPKIDEQAAIVHHIETETARIDAKIAKTKRIIELQKEYRTALISEVVTGKIKVSHLTSEEVVQ
jgi:type I restriction enzyme, S subunit